MKNSIKIAMLLSFYCGVILSCSEDKIPVYDGPDSINLYAKVDYQNGLGFYTYDSLEMSFLAFPPDYLEHRFELLVRVMGPASDADRTVLLGFGPDQTAVQGMDFTMETRVTVPAGQSEVVLPVTALHHDALEQEVVVDIIVLHSDDFVPAVKPEVKFKFSAEFPDNWYASEGVLGYTGYLLGNCTKAKYQWYYAVEGTIDLAPYATGWSDYATGPALIFKLNTAIDQHNAQFGSDESRWLKDDDGSNLRF